MLPVIPPLPKDNLSEEDFYSLGTEPLIKRLWLALFTLPMPRLRRGKVADPVIPDADL